MLRLIVRNTTSNIFLFVVKITITFILTPIFVRNLGNYDYGIWEVVGVLVGYMGMLDIGVGPAASRFAAYYNAKKDVVSLQKVFSTSVFFMLMVSIFLFIVIAIWAIFFPDTVAKNNSDTEKYTYFLFIIAIQLLFVFPGRIAESFLEGYQRYYLKNMITLVTSITGAILIYNYITPGNALILLALVNGAGLVIKNLTFFVMLYGKQFNHLVFKFSNVSKTQFKEIILFGYKTFIQGAASRIGSGANKVIIAILLEPSLVIYYALCANLTNYVSTVRMLLTHTFMPLFSHYHAIDRADEIKKWFLFGTRIVDACVYVLVLNILFLGKDFIAVWIGQEYADKGEIILYILCAYQFIVSFSPFSGRYLTAINKHGFIAKVMSVAVFFHIVLSILLAYVMGINGVAIGILLPALVTTPLILFFTCKNINITVGSFIKESVFPLLIPILFLISGVTIVKYYFTMNNYLNLVLAGATGSLFFAVAFYFFAMSGYEKEYLLSKLGLGRRAG